MNQVDLFGNSETLILSQLELFNWGGFNGRHQAAIDPAGTAVIGPTGSGKTTLVDALMTLLCANPRYNLASTGGHESDRDLVSYVRGVSGPGDGGTDQSHIARPGKTVTAIAATFRNEDKLTRLGALLWFEDTSSTASDLKKLWLFTESPEHTLEYWLTIHHEGGMRALRQMEKDSTGIWTYPSKKAFLARLRDYFDVGENAFTLLNRAAGLKQLNSIDEIFRELVLDDHSAFDRAAEVANSFDDLTEIHTELEIARRQQRSLLPIADGWEKHQLLEKELLEKETLKQILPVWFAEQAHRLWKSEAERLKTAWQQAEDVKASLESQVKDKKKEVDTRRQAYLNAGGSSIEDLEELIGEWRKTWEKRAAHARQYQQLVQNLGLPDQINADILAANQQETQFRLSLLKEEIQSAQDEAFNRGVGTRNANDQLEKLEKEYGEVLNRPGSNLPSLYHEFRKALAQFLELSDESLPFVAEMVQVKEDEQIWRGAIERAIGSHRLRILVPPEVAESALRWVNQRNNRLHVRLLEVKQPESKANFFDDGFTRKLSYKEHSYREVVKDLLAGIDRHCVDRPERLRYTPHAMTVQGLMSGQSRFFDKQDQKRLDEDWLTGFDNRDRLAYLQQEIGSAKQLVNETTVQLEVARALVERLTAQSLILEQVQNLDFEQIDLPGAEQKLTELNNRLEALTSPNSDAAVAKLAMRDAENQLKAIEKKHEKAVGDCARLQGDFDRAVEQKRKAFRRAEAGLKDGQKQLGAKNFPGISADQLDDIQDLERNEDVALQQQIKNLHEKLSKLAQDLARRMSDAQKEDRGALSEVGRELEDIPKYLERLQVLTEEALPEKLNRFLSYLNRSSDEGVTQLLSHIDNEVSMIEERIQDLNHTMRRVDFQAGRYLRLVSNKVVHESLRTLQRAQRQLNSARFSDDAGESQYKALQDLVALLRDACERNRTQGARALLDPRFRLEFKVSVIDRETGNIIETRSGSQGGSGGEKEIIASYVLTASLSYALCPDGSNRPLFGTIVLDEAFSRSSHAVAGRIIAALREFGLHAVFITPNKEMRLLRNHTRSAIVVHRRGLESTLTSLSWEALDDFHQQRIKAQHEVAG
ncbi:ATP-binding protein [Methylovulum miyakonense]|uniref:ATP-binding protein n=1 Tax=Methylovulum miyakonense TaxID=645578 RepID=UPI0003608B2A|nr:ATP-binding protein [Methylovulum miyakonense]